jgi:predicted negative regulator of RcsB-dependent stress response
MRCSFCGGSARDPGPGMFAIAICDDCARASPDVQASPLFPTAPSLSTDEAMQQLNRAVVALEAGRVDEAEALLRAGLPQCRLPLATLLGRLGRLDEAIAHFEVVVAESDKELAKVAGEVLARLRDRRDR